MVTSPGPPVGISFQLSQCVPDSSACDASSAGPRISGMVFSGHGRDSQTGGKDYAGKPRPVVIVQDDRFDMTASVTVCAFTTDPTDAPLFRLPIEPSERNGLRAACRLMVDKITTIPKTKLGTHIGRLADEDMVRLNRAVLVFLGIAAPPNESLEPG